MCSVPAIQKLNLQRLLGMPLIEREELETGILFCSGKRACQGSHSLPPAYTVTEQYHHPCLLSSFSVCSAFSSLTLQFRYHCDKSNEELPPG